MEKEKCIILNKPFIGGYIDQSNENEAHELINFFLDDGEKHFVYCNPYGQNVANAHKKDVKYIIFTSALKDNSFYIEYIVKVDKTLHTQSMPKAAEKNQETIKKKVAAAIKEITDNLKEYKYEELSDITYGKIPITEFFTDSIKVIPVTFLAEAIYKVKNPIKVENSENAETLFDYNFQRNFGYVAKNTKSPRAYEFLEKVIEKTIKDNELSEKIELKKFNSNGSVAQVNPTFMDLISMFRQEECYTQILFKLFKYKKEYIKEFLQFLKSKKKIIKNLANDCEIKVEYVIKNVGRLDLYAFNDYENVVLENKIDSGINYVIRGNQKIDQLSRYYDYFEKSNPEKNIYIILVPNEKISHIKAEINNLNTHNDDVKEAFSIVGYDEVYEFFKEKAKKGELSNFEYAHYIDGILEIFRRLSLTRQQMCEENLLNNIKKKNL